MQNVPDDRKYTREHLWVQVVGDDRVRVGITNPWQSSLGDINRLELPDEGTTIDASQPAGVVESTTAVAELRMPMSGTVATVNKKTVAAPSTVNTDPYGEGWLFELTVDKPAQLDGLFTASQYLSHDEGGGQDLSG